MTCQGWKSLCSTALSSSFKVMVVYINELNMTLFRRLILLAMSVCSRSGHSLYILCFFKLKTWFFPAYKAPVLFRRDNPLWAQRASNQLATAAEDSWQMRRLVTGWYEHTQKNSFLCLEILFAFGIITSVSMRFIQLQCWIFIWIMQAEKFSV